MAPHRSVARSRRARARGDSRTARTRARSDSPAQGHYRGSEPPGVNLLPNFTLRAQRRHPRLFEFARQSSSCQLRRQRLHRHMSGHRRPARTGPTAACSGRTSTGHRAGNQRRSTADTPTNVRRLLAKRRAIGQLIYLVAPTNEMKPVWKSFSILSAVESGNADTHSSSVRIFKRTGKWVSPLNAGADLTISNLLHDLGEAMRG